MPRFRLRQVLLYYKNRKRIHGTFSFPNILRCYLGRGRNVSAVYVVFLFTHRLLCPTSCEQLFSLQLTLFEGSALLNRRFQCSGSNLQCWFPGTNCQVFQSSCLQDTTVHVKFVLRCSFRTRTVRGAPPCPLDPFFFHFILQFSLTFTNQRNGIIIHRDTLIEQRNSIVYFVYHLIDGCFVNFLKVH